MDQTLSSKIQYTNIILSRLRTSANVPVISLLLETATAYAQTESPLTGAWSFGDASNEGSGVLVFLSNGKYFHMEDVASGDSDPDGIELGNFTWDQSTGAFSASQVLDTNGGVGLSDVSDIEGFSVSGDTLTISFTGGESESFPRVTSGSSALVGAWQFGNGQAEDSGAIVFLDNGYYFHGEDSSEEEFETKGEKDGIEKGTYTWEGSGGSLSANILIDENGTSGLSLLHEPFLVSVQGDTLLVSEDGVQSELYRVGATSSAPETVSFTDAALESAVRDALDQPSGDIATDELQALTRLNAQVRGIERLGGLEYATGLTRLTLAFNQISDLSPLSTLTSLTHLNLSHNEITTLDALNGLTNLAFLDVSDNLLEDPGAFTSSTRTAPTSDATGVLASLPSGLSLTTLRFANNLLRDLQPLRTRSLLQEIDLSGNQVKDLSPLTDLISLETVAIYGNPLDLSEGSDQQQIVVQLENSIGTSFQTEAPNRLETQGPYPTFNHKQRIRAPLGRYRRPPAYRRLPAMGFSS